MKFFKREQKKATPLPISNHMKQKLAEAELSGKINKLAEWLEAQKDWNLFDGYVVLSFILKQSLGPQLGEKKHIADKAVDALFIAEIIESASPTESDNHANK